MYQRKNVEIKNPKLMKKTLYYSLTVLILIIIIAFIKSDYEVEFYEKYKNIYSYFMIILFPLHFGLFSYTILRFTKNDSDSAMSISILFSLIFIFLIFLFSFFDMCGFLVNKTLYVNKNDNSLVQIRYYDCGAYDSSLPKYKTQIVYDHQPFLKYAVNIDTNDLDKSEWEKWEDK